MLRELLMELSYNAGGLQMRVTHAAAGDVASGSATDSPAAAAAANSAISRHVITVTDTTASDSLASFISSQLLATFIVLD